MDYRHAFTRGMAFGKLIERVAHAESLEDEFERALSIMQLEPDDNDERTTSAYRTLAKATHPGKIPAKYQTMACATFQVLKNARELLLNARPERPLRAARLKCDANAVGTCQFGRGADCRGSYFGTLNEEGIPTGSGCILYESGDVFVGKFKSSGEPFVAGVLYDMSAMPLMMFMDGDFCNPKSEGTTTYPFYYPFAQHEWWLSIVPCTEPPRKSRRSCM